jgi:3'-phosphoadenosine 5'-phosphosulfate (PAPS) 3'-phosphatase
VRLSGAPCATYREKVWDHAAGAAVVTEAGGDGLTYLLTVAIVMAPKRGG